jgi:DNA-binding response OmpR family regulator
MRLLIIEDESGIAKPLVSFFTKKNFVVEWFSNGLEGYKIANNESFDCIILDLNLPDMDGIEIAKKLRSNEINTPILMLTARGSHENLLEGFESGTDDYLAKPFDLKELLYRVNALIKRNNLNKTEILEAGNVKLDSINGSVLIKNKKIDLNRKEYGVLEYLLRNKGKIISQEELLEHVWDREIDIFTQTVRTNIKTLRKKVDPDKILIKTVNGRGYIIE